MTKDHVASDEKERERISSVGGVVVWYISRFFLTFSHGFPRYSGGWRVNGQMAVSRSIGNFFIILSNGHYR